jgi:hypothetical protein
LATIEVIQPQSLYYQRKHLRRFLTTRLSAFQLDPDSTHVRFSVVEP